jgi:PhnB protein
MARVSTYLNFPGTTEQAFAFYKTAFKSEYAGPIQRFDQVPPNPGQPLSEAEKKLILHIALPILGGHVLMATEALKSMGPTVNGTNMSINLEPDTREETKRLFEALSAGGEIGMPLQDMFWGGYFASFTDKFGIRWMMNCTSKA